MHGTIGSHVVDRNTIFGKNTPFSVYLRISNKRLYEGAIDCASLCKLHYCMSLIRH